MRLCRREFSCEREISGFIALVEYNYARAKAKKSCERERESTSRLHPTRFNASRYIMRLRNLSDLTFMSNMDTFNKQEQSCMKEKLTNCVFANPEIWDKRLIEHRNRKVINIQHY